MWRSHWSTPSSAPGSITAIVPCTASQLQLWIVLQSILNAAARLILRVPKYGHISAAIRDRLHWLPVRRRIEFRICMLVRNSLSRTAPAYLMDLCLPSSSVPGRRHLRSAGKGDLVVPSLRRERSGRRGFSVAGPCCWNSLPPTIRCLADQPETFKKALKTYFMQQYWLSASAVS